MIMNGTFVKHPRNRRNAKGSGCWRAGGGEGRASRRQGWPASWWSPSLRSS